MLRAVIESWGVVGTGSWREGLWGIAVRGRESRTQTGEVV
jgi:hypothetical protein